MKARPLVCALAVWCLLGSPTRRARAQQPPSPTQAAAAEQAREHARQGQALHKAGDYDAAITQYKVAYTLSPVPELLFNIAQAYRLKGDTRSAVFYYRRYLDAKPDGSVADAARSQLDK